MCSVAPIVWIRCLFGGYLILMEIMTELFKKRQTLAELYAEAFKKFSTEALWNMRPVENPTPEDALAIARALRTHGNMPGRRLAEQIEQLARAAH